MVRHLCPCGTMARYVTQPLGGAEKSANCACGERLKFWKASAWRNGSSPRVRGTPGGAIRQSAIVRSHLPRVRGTLVCGLAAFYRGQGSSRACGERGVAMMDRRQVPASEGLEQEPRAPLGLVYPVLQKALRWRRRGARSHKVRASRACLRLVACCLRGVRPTYPAA